MQGVVPFKAEMDGLLPMDFDEAGWLDELEEVLEDGDDHHVLWTKHRHDTTTYSLEELSDVDVDEHAGIGYPYGDILPLEKYQEGWDCAGFGQYERAREAFGPLLEADVAGAHSFLCEMHWKGVGGFEKDKHLAQHHYDRLIALVEEGDPEALMMLAFQYDDGILVEKDRRKAVEYWGQAAEMGHAVAIRVLACCHLNGLNDTPIDAGRALEMLRTAATMGDRHANYQLGLLYHGSTILPHDIRRALQYYKYAADRSYSYARAALGDLYYDNVGLERDYAKAFEMYELAMDRGYARPLCDIGAMYFYGLHLEQSYGRAFECMVDAWKKDCTTGRVFIGLMLYYGLGLPEDALEQVRKLHTDEDIPECAEEFAEGMCLRKRTALSLLAKDAVQDSDSALHMAIITYEEIVKRRETAIGKELAGATYGVELSDLELSSAAAVLARSIPTSELQPALNWSYRSAGLFNSFGRILSLWLPLTSNLDLESAKELRHVVPKTRTSILIEVVRRLPEACMCPSLARRLHSYLDYSCKAGCSLSLELKANLCAEGLGQENGLPDLEQAMSLYHEAGAHDKGESHSILYNFQVCVAALGNGSHWTPSYHSMYSSRFKATVATLLVLWQREDTPFSALPLEIMHHIIRAIQPLPPTAAPIVKSLLASERETALAAGESFDVDAHKLARFMRPTYSRPEMVVKTFGSMNPPLPDTTVLGKLALEWKVIPNAFRFCHRFYRHAEDCLGDKDAPGPVGC